MNLAINATLCVTLASILLGPGVFAQTAQRTASVDIEGWRLPEGSGINPPGSDVKSQARFAIDVLNFWTNHPHEVFHNSAAGYLPIVSLGGFEGKVKIGKSKVDVKGITLVLRGGGQEFIEYGGVTFAQGADSAAIRFAPNGKGVLALTVDGTEWLLPNFDPGEAHNRKGYAYSGPFEKSSR